MTDTTPEEHTGARAPSTPIDTTRLRELLNRGPTTPVHQTGRHLYSAGLTHLAEVYSESGGRLIVAAVNALPGLLAAARELPRLQEYNSYLEAQIREAGNDVRRAQRETALQREDFDKERDDLAARLREAEARYEAAEKACEINRESSWEAGKHIAELERENARLRAGVGRIAHHCRFTTEQAPSEEAFTYACIRLNEVADELDAAVENARLRESGGG